MHPFPLHLSGSVASVGTWSLPEPSTNISTAWHRSGPSPWPAMLQLTFMQSYETFANASVLCLGSCRCSALLQGTAAGRRTSEPVASLIELQVATDASAVTRERGGCMVRVESVGFFKLIGVAMVDPALKRCLRDH